jgi:hypothetical protein
MEILHNTEQKVCTLVRGDQAMDILLYDVA